MPVLCPRCFASRRIASAYAYRSAHQLDRDTDDDAGVHRQMLQWRSLALETQASWEALEGADVLLCVGHGGTAVPLRRRVEAWLAKYAEVGFANIAGLAVLGWLASEGHSPVPRSGVERAIGRMAEWLRDRSAGGVRFDA